MLKMREYVRCPSDLESKTDPRLFECGQVTAIDEIGNTVEVTIYDPFKTRALFSEDLPGTRRIYPMDEVQKCTFFVGSSVMFQQQEHTVLCGKEGKDEYQYYYLQNVHTKEIGLACETGIVAPFNNGRVDPAVQLGNYEFQHPIWYFSRKIVAENIRILNNSLYGFKELAGAKIYLMPHQVNTIMRCLQESPCRFMLADEVGMGKTIEAISILKIFMRDHCGQNILILVPAQLREQWRGELLIKFGISSEESENRNRIVIRAVEQLTDEEVLQKWDFIVIDEVHRFLQDKRIYHKLHQISKSAGNILLLSATPVQQRMEEYHALLSLLQPQRYGSLTPDQFSRLVSQQTLVIQGTSLILNDLEDYEKLISECQDTKEDPSDSEECEDLFAEIEQRLRKIEKALADPELSKLCRKIDFESEDYGVYDIKVAVSYICSNYQMESNIIRNRRKMLESEESERTLPVRKLIELPYELDADRNVYEKMAYDSLIEWVINEGVRTKEFAKTHIRPIISAFFSSPWAYYAQISREAFGGEYWDRVKTDAQKWLDFENKVLGNVKEILDDPDSYPDEYATRIATVLDAILQKYYDEKIVVFTSYPETFHAYKTAMEALETPEVFSFFGEEITSDEIELNAYRFQNTPDCLVLLCDQTGGEGRNFQCADYALHIDLPWDASAIEQRIGRLDRLERDPNRNVVSSIVVHAKDTFEDSLFQFWKNGLNIFNHSLSGMEIIMSDVNDMILSAVCEDFRYGLADSIPKIVTAAEKMQSEVKKEQRFDAAAKIYNPMFIQLRQLIEYYSQNENQIFADTITQWANLAGFRGTPRDGILRYSENSFANRSALKAMFIPPVNKWGKYSAQGLNALIGKVESQLRGTREIRSSAREIRGTFIRKTAIENDYIHFFAPGDLVFDSIVDNALNSCKGQSTAVRFKGEHNWKGFLFLWSPSPNEAELYRNKVSPVMLSAFRNFVMTKSIQIPISLDNSEDLTDKEILHMIGKYAQNIRSKSSFYHIGERSVGKGALPEAVGMSNIRWFREYYPDDVWKNLVSTARAEALEKAGEIIQQNNNWRGAREEMDRIRSALEANSHYYGLSPEPLEELKRKQALILHALKNAKITLEAMAYIEVTKAENGNTMQNEP